MTEEFALTAEELEEEMEPDRALDEERKVVNYHFPVEVVLVGSLPDEEREQIATQIWERLTNVLAQMT